MPLVRRRRPLLRAAAVGGAGYAAGKRAAAGREAAEPPPQQDAPPPQPSAPTGGLSADAVARLKELAELRDQGILTDAEFEQQKRALLGGGQ
jgi:hypothetical protein